MGILSKKIKASIIIPSWKDFAVVKKNLPIVIKYSSGFEIIVVNSSPNKKIYNYISKNFPGIRSIYNGNDAGFVKNVNTGVTVAKGDIIILLNTDVTPTRNTFINLLRTFKNKKIFAVGCREVSFKKQETLVYRNELRWHLGTVQTRQTQFNSNFTAWVSGGSGAFRKSVWIKLNGMDELYNPFYWEDVDICYRAFKLGYRCITQPSSIVFHDHSNGAIANNFTSEKILSIYERNAYFFIWKNISGLKLLSHFLILPVRLMYALIRWDLWKIAGFFKALFDVHKVIDSRLKTSPKYFLNNCDLNVWS